MSRFATSSRALAAAAAVVVLFSASVTPTLAGDDLIVEPGDTLWDIARRHRTTVGELVRLNDIVDPSLIRVGERIVLHAPAVQPPSALATTPAPTAPLIHVVRRDETLWSISRQHGTTISAIVDANDIANPSIIQVGQALLIPVVVATPTAAPAATGDTTASNARFHLVARGQTLWSISRQYGITVDALAAANDISDPSFIRTGQQLVIPGNEAVSPAPSLVTDAMSPEMAAKVAGRSAARDLLLAAAREFGVPGPFVLAVAWQESGWLPDITSNAGAVGLMQLMPATAEWVAGSMLGEAPAISDPRWNARAGVRLLAFYLARYDGDKARTLAAYFQGMTSADQVGILTSTQRYIDTILALERMFSR